MKFFDSVYVVSFCLFCVVLFVVSPRIRLVLFLLLGVVLSCLLLRLIRFLLSYPSCLVFARPDRLVFLLYFCVYSSPSVTRLVRIISVCSSCFALSRGVCPFSSSAFFYFVMSVYVSSCPPCLGLSVLSCPVRLVSFHSSGLVLFWPTPHAVCASVHRHVYTGLPFFARHTREARATLVAQVTIDPTR